MQSVLFLQLKLISLISSPIYLEKSNKLWHIIICQRLSIYFQFFLLKRKISISLFRLRKSNNRSIHITRGAGPRMARQVSEMRWMWPIPGRKLHMLCAPRQDLLQTRLRASLQQEMLQVQGELQQEWLCHARQQPHIPRRMFPLLHV